MPPLPITTVFDDLPDPRRQTKNTRHRLTDVLPIAPCAVICGADSWDAIAEYGGTKVGLFRRFLPRPNGLPGADTFARVFAELDPAAFSRAFGRWMAAACEAVGLVPVAIDGKSVRRAQRNTATGGLTVVSAWAAENRLALGQVAVPDGSNEIGVIPELLRARDLTGALVTIGAAGCQVEDARLIRERGGHSLLAVKADQPSLRAAVEAVVADACGRDFVGVTMDGAVAEATGHGRREARYVTVITAPVGLPEERPAGAAVVQVHRERTAVGTTAATAHFYLTSSAGTAAELAGWVRGHWGIENGSHGVLDVVFRGDGSRVREGHAGADPALLRRVAASLLARAPGKRTTPTKRLKAGRDDDYLLQVFQGLTADVVR